MAFTVNARGDATAVTLRPGEPRERLAPRVAPLPGTLQPTPDPDASLTIRITAALEAIRHGGAALSAAADVTPGAKQDFSRARIRRWRR